MTTISGRLEHERLNAEKMGASALAYSSLRKPGRPIDYPILCNFIQSIEAKCITVDNIA
jgi:hypothetical protein